MEIDRIQYISQAPEGGTHIDTIARVLRSGVRWIQLRIKDQDPETILPVALHAAALCREYQARLIINDYPAIALAADAYGVHLGLDDMPVPQARAILGPDKCIGGTANTLEDMRRRADEGADYIGLGPYRFTATKKKLSPLLGLEGYQRLMEQARMAGITLPVIAIGGILQHDIEAILKTGIYGIAVSGLLTRNTDLKLQAYVNDSR